MNNTFKQFFTFGLVSAFFILSGCTNDAETPTYDNTDVTLKAHTFTDCMKSQNPAINSTVAKNPEASIGIDQNSVEQCSNNMDLKDIEKEAMKTKR